MSPVVYSRPKLVFFWGNAGAFAVFFGADDAFDTKNPDFSGFFTGQFFTFARFSVKTFSRLVLRIKVTVPS